VKILLATHVFAPSVGGIETCSLDLARAFTSLGCEVQVVTQTFSNNPADNHDLTVIRRPSKSELIQAIRWCDVFFQNNISLQTAWPVILIRKPWVVCTATWLTNPDGSVDLACKSKMWALRFATNIYISSAIRDHVGYPGHVIPNPYNSNAFKLIGGIPRARSLVFLGRLVSDKGCDVLIQSLAQLRNSGLALPLTIIGSGSEEARLKNLVAEKQLERLVQFVGALRGEALARELNRHQVMVVPSRWNEPFGVVALEGIACGCLVVGSAGGGLPDAIGLCGKTFKNGDPADLSNAIREVLELSETMQDMHATITTHLNHHRLEHIATRYLDICKEQYLKFVGNNRMPAHNLAL
jgi:glycogen synthase